MKYVEVIDMNGTTILKNSNAINIEFENGFLKIVFKSNYTKTKTVYFNLSIVKGFEYYEV